MAGPAIEIRAERPDHPDVLALLAELDRYLGSLYAPHENHILDVASLRSPEITFLVAAHEAGLVGCGAVRRMPGEPSTDGLRYAEVKRMIVRPSMRGHRIGEQILTCLEATVRAEGVHLSLLETGALQTAAVRLYERCGYRRRGAFGGYPDNGKSLFLEKRLLP
jgi:putative acetyltransferase